MAEAKRLEPIELVAVERGFVNGKMVHPGQRFLFDPNPTTEAGEKRKVGKDGLRRIPSWAARPEDAVKRKAKPVSGDTRPADVVAAVKAKAGAATGDTPLV